MSENQLHDILSEMVQVYSQKNQTRIETPAKIGTHLHPLLDRMCEEAEARGASDIIISKGFPPSLKINGTLTIHPHKALTDEETAAIAESTMNADQLETFIREREINYSVQSRSNTRYRVNAHYHQGCVGIVLRRINQRIPEMQALGLPEKLKDLSLAPRGLLIIAGPTGSGKSTTMATMLEHRNQQTPGHIITIEDPIEFVHPHKNCIITQREVGVDTENWFAALKNTLRQAPDVILIGEIRDRETMDYALAFAETGHLCMATLHANNSNQALDRIINFFPEERRTQLLNDLSLNLKGFISQRLVPKPDGKGRVAAVEVLLNSPLIAELILNGDIHGVKEIMARSRDLGMQTFDQSLFDLYEEGLISYDDALKNADSVNDLRLNIQLNSKRGNAGQASGIDSLAIVGMDEAEEA